MIGVDEIDTAWSECAPEGIESFKRAVRSVWAAEEEGLESTGLWFSEATE